MRLGRQIGYGQDTVWAANTFRAGEKEELKAAGFYATGPDTEYEMYLARYLPEVQEGIFGAEKESQSARMDRALNDRRLIARGN